MKRFKILLFIIISFAIVFILNFTFIQVGDGKSIFELPKEGTDGGAVFQGGGSNKLADPFGGKTIFTIIQSIIGYLILIGAPILAVMVIYGGFLILTAGDSPEKVKSGKDVILWAVVGYTIVLCSWGVIYIMGQIITGNPDTFIKKIPQK